MKRSIKIFGMVALFATVLFASCKKEETANPVASFTITSNDTLYVSDTFTFNNTSTGADSYIWNFDDGTTSTAVNPTKTYDGYDFIDCEETFTITLTATKNGKSTTTSKNVVVYFCS